MFDALLETLAEMVERDTSADMIDSRVIRAHHCAVGLKRGSGTRGAWPSHGGFTTKLHARCDGQGRPLGFVLTPGQAHDVQGFGPLVRMLAGKGYDADAIREEIAAAGAEAVILAKTNRRTPIPHDREKYCWRNLLEMAFSKMKAHLRRIGAHHR